MDRSLNPARSICLRRMADSGLDQMNEATWPTGPVAIVHRLPEPTRTRRMETSCLHGRPYDELISSEATQEGWDWCGTRPASGNA